MRRKKEKEPHSYMAQFVCWLLHLMSRKTRKQGLPIYYIRGTGRHYPIYLLYTEDEDVWHRMKEF